MFNHPHVKKTTWALTSYRHPLEDGCVERVLVLHTDLRFDTDEQVGDFDDLYAAVADYWQQHPKEFDRVEMRPVDG